MLTEADYLALTREHEALQGIVLRSERLSDEALDQVVERLLAIEEQLAESPPKTIRSLHALLLVLQRCVTCDAFEKTAEALLEMAVTATQALAAQLSPGRPELASQALLAPEPVEGSGEAQDTEEAGGRLLVQAAA